MALDFDQSKQNTAKCEPSRHGKTQNVNVPASQNRLVSGRTKNLTTAAKLALLNYSVYSENLPQFFDLQPPLFAPFRSYQKMSRNCRSPDSQ